MADFNKNYFRFKKYTDLNFLICQYIDIKLQACIKLKKSYVAFFSKMTVKIGNFSLSANSAFLGTCPGHVLVNHSYLKK